MRSRMVVRLCALDTNRFGAMRDVRRDETMCDDGIPRMRQCDERIAHTRIVMPHDARMMPA